MENITFGLSDQYLHGSAFYDFLALRKTYFVDQLGWEIPHDDRVEMDQYDNPMARYSLVLDGDAVIAGARAMSTTAQWGEHSYMLRDAITGKLPTIPKVMEEAFNTPRVWECTRLVIADSVTTQAERSECLDLIVDGLIGMAAAQGGDRLIALSNAWLLRSLRKLGYATEVMSRPYESPEDGHKYFVMAIGTERTKARLPRATHRTGPTPLHAPAAAA